MGSAGVSEEEVGAGEVLGGDDLTQLFVGDEDEAVGGRRWLGGRQEAQYDAQGSLGDGYIGNLNYFKNCLKLMPHSLCIFKCPSLSIKVVPEQ